MINFNFQLAIMLMSTIGTILAQPENARIHSCYEKDRGRRNQEEIRDCIQFKSDEREHPYIAASTYVTARFFSFWFMQFI